MRFSNIVLAAMAGIMICSCGSNKKGDNAMNNEFNRAQVAEDAVKFFDKDGGLLVAAGDKDSSNAMTIAWGGLGTLWQKPVCTVYVAEGRYTYNFMENSQYFTVMQFEDKEVLRYMGTHSGRDGDKAAALNLHTKYTKNGAPYYEEAVLVLECRLMYKSAFDPEKFTDDVPKQFYDGFNAGYHHMYIGEIVDTIKK